jgi:hypothetical protein
MPLGRFVPPDLVLSHFLFGCQLGRLLSPPFHLGREQLMIHVIPAKYFKAKHAAPPTFTATDCD